MSNFNANTARQLTEEADRATLANKIAEVIRMYDNICENLVIPAAEKGKNMTSFFCTDIKKWFGHANDAYINDLLDLFKNRGFKVAVAWFDRVKPLYIIEW